MNLGWWWKLLGTQIHAITVPRKNLIMNWNTICFKPDFRRKTQNCSKTRLQFVKQNIFCCSSIKISSHRLGKPPSYARKFSKKKKIHANKNPTIKKEDGLEPFDATRRVEKSHQIKEGLTKRFILSKPKYGKRYLINTYLHPVFPIEFNKFVERVEICRLNQFCEKVWFVLGNLLHMLITYYLYSG